MVHVGPSPGAQQTLPFPGCQLQRLILIRRERTLRLLAVCSDYQSSDYAIRAEYQQESIIECPSAELNVSRRNPLLYPEIRRHFHTHTQITEWQLGPASKYRV